MKRIFVLLLLPVALARAADTAADTAWKALQAIAAERPEGADKLPVDQHQRWIADQAVRYSDKALSFIEKFPSDPHRWEAVAHLIEHPPLVFKPYPPGAEPPASATDTERLRALTATLDREANAAWRKKIDALSAAMAAAPDATEEQHALVASQELKRVLVTGGYNRANDELVAFWEKIEAFAQKYPRSDIPYALASQYLSLMTRRDAAYTEPTLKKMAASLHARISEFATGKLRALELQKKRFELLFTAVDGREVDVGKLAGKVVLVDFWATWCGPCVAELPNVKKVYAAYHEKGFEVIGISLDQAKDKQKLIDFTKANDMPWPQYFDGKYWKNEIAVRHAINSIPAMFLLDQNGMIVSTNARGPKLEEEVKRLLKL